MILLNLEKINPLNGKYNLDNINYEDVLNSYENLLNFGLIKCPCCGSTNYIKWGYYERNVIYVKNKALISKVIKVQRIKCKGCNHTHSLIPDGIVPYKQFNLKTIIDSLIDNKYNISENIINKWYKQLQKIFKPLLRTTFVEKKQYKLKTMIELEKDRQYFLKKNKRYFFQIKIISISYAPS